MKLELTWEEVNDRALKIAQQICSIEPEFKRPIKIYGIPRGGIYVAILVQKMFGGIGTRIVEDPKTADVWVDDIIDSGRTVRNLKEKTGVSPLVFPLVTKEEKEETKAWYSFPWERMAKEDGIEDHVVRILQYVGENPQREGLKDTPKRVIKSWMKIFGGYRQNPEDCMTVFEEGATDQIVVLRNIEFYSTCEHHMQPFHGKAHIGYLPDKKVIGVSKLARLLEIYARRLQIQERIGEQVSDALMKNLQPKGCGVVLEASHMCMTCRGVEKQNSIMVTSAMRGLFLSDRGAKEEFLRLIGK